MSEFKGTPGPWIANGNWVEFERGDICQTKGGFESDTARANARLIAAAPDLAAELREARTTIAITRTQIMVELNRGVERWDGVPEALKLRLDAIDGVLAKALGEGQ